MLDIRGITRAYGNFTVFHDVDLTVRPGVAYAVVGENGSGKSTFLRCVSGADEIDGGQILFDGIELDESSPSTRGAIASVVDDPAFFPHLSVREHLTLIATAHGVADADGTVDRVCRDMTLTSAADQLPVTLSSGQRRRTALASAFVRPRRVLILDEPEQHLDEAGRHRLARSMMRDKESGVGVLFVSHDRTLVDAVADVVVDADTWR